MLYGPFDEKTAASTALASLPDSLRTFHPYIRSLDAVRDEASRAERK